MKKRLLVGIYDSGGSYTVHLSKELDGGGFGPVKALTPEPKPSVYAVQRDGRRLEGNAVLQLNAEELSALEGFWTDLKTLPGTGNDEVITEFAGLIYQEVRQATGDFYGREPIWVVACPGHWLMRDVEARERYIALLQRAGMERVIVCEEAVAALVYYRKALQVVAEENQSKGVLFLNWDVQELHYTFFYPFRDRKEEDKRTETGSCALGTYLIDQAIVRAVLYQPEEYGLEGLNDAQLVQKVQRRYEEDERFQRWMYVHAGKLKETYVRAMTLPGLKPRRTQLKWEEKVDCGGGDIFRLALSIAMMEALLSRPLEEIVPDFRDYPESVREDLGRDSYILRSERFLKELSYRYPAYADAQDTLLILAGSVSQMDFVRRAVGTYLPNRKIDYDNCPELSVGRGLVYYGRELPKDTEPEESSEHTESMRDVCEESARDRQALTSDDETYRSFVERFDQLSSDLTGDPLKSFCESYVQDMVKEVVAYLEHYRRGPGRGRYSTGIGVMREWQSNDFHTLRAQYSERLTERLNEAYKDLLHQYGYKQPLFGEGENWLEMYQLFFLNVFDNVAQGENSFFGTQNRIYQCMKDVDYQLERWYLECRQGAECRLIERAVEIIHKLKKQHLPEQCP